MPKLEIQDILYSQGLGSRKGCTLLIEQGTVTVNGTVIDNPEQILEATGLTFVVQGHTWQYHEKAYVMLHKPAGYECSHKPSAWPGIYSLLPSPLRLRPTKTVIEGIQAIGRLDQDTTGLLILSDDGQFIHKLSSPKHHAPKVYEVTTKHPIDDQQVKALLSGVVLDDDPKPVSAAACEAVSEHHLKLTLTQGKYHQVKRMVAAVSNRVEALHRSQIGSLQLPSDLAPGQWRWLTADDLSKLKK